MVVLFQLTMVRHQLLSLTIPDDTASQHDTRSVRGAIISGNNRTGGNDIIMAITVIRTLLAATR